MQTTGLKGAHLSLQQERLWSFQRWNHTYQIQCAVRVQGPLEVNRFHAALGQLIERHEILHTIFYSLPGMDIPVQVIHPAAVPACPVISLEHCAPLQSSLLESYFSALQQEAFALAHVPLLRTVLIRLSREAHIFLFSIPALCADFLTLSLFLNELTHLYASQSTPWQFSAEEKLQYIDVSSWQDTLEDTEQAKVAGDFWRHFESTDITPLVGQPDYRDDEAQLQWLSSFQPATITLPFAESLLQAIEALASAQKISSSAILLASWQIVLQRLFGNIPIGVVCDGRMYEELAQLPGLYAHVVPLIVEMENDSTFEERARLVEQRLRKITQWQSYFALPPDGPAFFPVAFEYGAATPRSDIIQLSLERYFSCTEPFVLKLSALQIGACVQINLTYDAQSFSAKTATQIVTAFQTVLQGAVAQPRRSVRLLPILTPAEERASLKRGQTAHVPLPMRAFQQLFEAQVAERPWQLAVRDKREQLTYQELDWRSNQLARVLRQKGVGPGILVGLYLQRSIQMIVSLLAVFKAGGAYTPLDSESPAARLAYQLQDAQTLLLLTEEELLSRVPFYMGEVFCLEANRVMIEQASQDTLPQEPHPLDLAYVIYTSGSTGHPKGVMISQQSIVNYTQAMNHKLACEPGWNFATVSTLAADLGNTTIFCALASGGCLHILDYATVTSGAAMAHWSELHPVDVLKIVPSHLSALLASEYADRILPRRALILGGETLTYHLLERLQQVDGSCVIYNHYGPTETTIGVLVNPLGHLHASDEPFHKHTREAVSAPLGHPIQNNEVYVLDTCWQLVPTGWSGELYIGGMGLASGYIGKAEQTASRFIPHPYSTEPGARLYRTGDLVRLGTDGQIEFLGRGDKQVKLRGYRIETGEIEAMLKQHENVWDCVVLLREDQPGEPALTAYIVSVRQPVPTYTEMYNFLLNRVPGYMIPSHFLYLKNLPLTTNGKLDRSLLPVPDPQREEEEPFFSLPHSPLESGLLEIWEDLLPASIIGIHDNFFQMGGHSLLATRVISRIREVWQVELPITNLFERPTIASLAQKLENVLRGQYRSQLPLLLPAVRKHQLPLSFAQQRLWFLDQLDASNIAYLLPRSRRFAGRLDVQALERSLREIVQRHEILRTTFSFQGDHPFQTIHGLERFTFPVIDLCTLTLEKREEHMRQLARQEARRRSDLEHGPLLRIFLVRLDLEEHVFLQTMHHIISDGWSNEIFSSELSTLYRAFSAGHPSPLPPLPVQYADFAIWQRQWLQGKLLEEQLTYWRGQLANTVTLDFPTDRSRPPLPSFRGALYTTTFPPELQQQLIALSRRENVTLFILLLAAFQILLARYTGETDICIGTPIANRTHADIEKLIGFFVNMLVLRSDLSGNITFRQALARVREVALNAYTYQDIPFEHLVEELQPERDLSRHPFFRIMLEVQQLQTNGEQAGPQNERRSTIPVEHHTTKFDITVNVVSSKQKLFCVVEYSTDLFDEQTIRSLIAHWQILLQGIVAAPDTLIAQLPLLSTAELQQQRTTWNETQQLFPSFNLVHKCVEAQVEKSPDVVALTFGEHCLSYSALERRSNQLAQYLQRRGVRSGSLVGILLERSPDLVIGLLSILKAGGVYVPLDPEYPSERLASIIQDSGLQVLLTREWLLDRSGLLPELEIVCLERDYSSIAQEKVHRPASALTAEDLAYVIYTSGSTGKPKGVQTTHAAVVNFLCSMREQPGLQASDTLLAVTTISFDIAGLEIFLPLTTGARLVLLDRESVIDGSILARQISETGATILQATPATWRGLYEVGWQGSPELKILCGGEALPGDLATWLLKQGASVWNLYGPTETTIWSTLSRVETEESSISIGRPIANTQTYIVDSLLLPVPVGVTGYLFIGGAGVARGYLNRPDLTAERFLPDPFSDKPGQRLYMTGDRACYRPDGTLLYLGRLDAQVKIRGYRIELGEVEHALLQHPQVQRCVVLVRQETPEDRRIVAYLVSSRQDAQQLAHELRTFLSTSLPQYMLPAHFVTLECFPLTPNGKINRQALLSLELFREEEAVEQENARTQIEELLLTIWSDLLRHDHISITDNFYDLGGHSLFATRVSMRIYDVLQVKVSLEALFESPTIADLARHIEALLREHKGIAAPPLVPVARTQALPLSFAQQRLWFLNQLDPGNIAYLVRNAQRLAGPLQIQAVERSFAALVYRHESLRTTFSLQDEQVVQIIHPAHALPLPLIDLSELDQGAREKACQGLTIAEAHLPFDLQAGPLLRMFLLRLGQEEHQLLCTFHHIISDAWSNEIFQRELVALYQSTVNGQTAHLPELPIQYVDFAVWQRQWLKGEVLAAHIQYWKKQLDGMVPLELPTDRPRPERQSYHGAIHYFAVPATLSKAIVEICHQEEVTLFMFLLATFQILLQRFSGQQDIVVGTDVANRNRIETEGTIGFFINQLVLRSDLSGDPTFKFFLKQVRNTAVQAYIHQDLPFEKLVEVIQPERNLQSSPLFQVKLLVQEGAYQAPAAEASTVSAVSVRPMSIFAETVQLDIILRMFHGPQGLSGSVSYRTDVFEEVTIQRMTQQFLALLENICHDPTTSISQLALLSRQEQEQKQMKQQGHSMEAFNRFKTTKPKPINIQQEKLVTSEYLSAEQRSPLVISPAEKGLDLLDWTKDALGWIEEALLTHGALLFRGFELPSPETFEHFASLFCTDLFEENGEHVPVQGMGSGHLYTPVFYAPEKKLLWHNENSFNSAWPMKIWFHCAQPATSGGETPIADSRRVWAALDQSIRETFLQKRILYVRNYGEGLGLNWQTVFRTERKSEVEEHCRKTSIEFEWKDSDRLQTRQVRPAVLKHPTTQEPLWWNQATHWHPACLDETLRASLLSLLPAEELPRNCYYGDGSSIDDAVMTAICRAYEEAEVCFAWQTGDILLLDNMLFAHARNPFVGPRKIYVAMGQMVRLDQMHF